MLHIGFFACKRMCKWHDELQMIIKQGDTVEPRFANGRSNDANIGFFVTYKRNDLMCLAC